MQKLLSIIILLTIGFSLPKHGNSQLYKQWGHWISDTAMNNKNYNSYMHGMVCDSIDNIYVQYDDSEQGENTLSIKCYNTAGEFQWKKDYVNNNVNQYLQKTYANLFLWGGRVIALQPYYIRGDGFYFQFFEISSKNGNPINTWTVKRPLQFAINHSNNFIINDDGNFYYPGYVYGGNEVSIIKINIPSATAEVHNFSCEDGNFLYSNPSAWLMDINDSLFAFNTATEYEAWQYGIQLNVVRKSDLSSHCVFDLQHFTGFEKSFVFGNHVKFVGGGLYELDITEKKLVGKEATNSRYTEMDKSRNMYLSNYNESSIRKVSPTGDQLWKYFFSDTNTNIKYGEVDMNVGKTITTTVPILRYIETEHWGDIYEIFGIRTSLLNNSPEIISDYLHTIDSSLGRIGEIFKVIDSKGNAIICHGYHKQSPIGTIPFLYNHSYYLYKVCSNCDTITPPPIAPESFENYLSIIENPAKDNLYYKFGIVTNNRLNFYISDISGKIVFKKNYKSFKGGQYQTNINLRRLGLSTGLYILNMQTTYRQYSQKFLYNP